MFRRVEPIWGNFGRGHYEKIGADNFEFRASGFGDVIDRKSLTMQAAYQAKTDPKSSSFEHNIRELKKKYYSNLFLLLLCFLMHLNSEFSQFFLI